jgi:hypothetical protein
LEAVNIGGAVPVEFSGVLAGDDYLLRTESVAEAVAGGTVPIRGDGSFGSGAVAAGGFGVL